MVYFVLAGKSGGQLAKTQSSHPRQRRHLALERCSTRPPNTLLPAAAAAAPLVVSTVAALWVEQVLL